MLAQVVLTPAESKKLIAMAIAELDVVKKAATGTIILHPSSSTYFIAEALIGSKPKTNTWVCGVVVPKGFCIEEGNYVGKLATTRNSEGLIGGPAAFSQSWVIREGRLAVGIPLSDLLNEIGPNDVYIKGANAIDPQGNIGVLVGSSVEGGTIALVISKWEEKGFNLIFPIGLEKMIPSSIPEVAKEARRVNFSYAMGIASGLWPCPPSITITEPKAIEILSGATAVPMAAGGLGGAEGAIVLLIKGDEAKVNKAINYVELSKGAKLPPVRICNCYNCPNPLCKFPLAGKPWVKW